MSDWIAAALVQKLLKNSPLFTFYIFCYESYSISVKIPSFFHFGAVSFMKFLLLNEAQRAPHQRNASSGQIALLLIYTYIYVYIYIYIYMYKYIYIYLCEVASQ